MNYSYSLYYVEWNYFEYVTAYVCIHMHVEVVGQSQWYSLTCLELAKQARLAGHCVPGTCGPSPGIPVHNTTHSLVTAHSTACSLVWHYLTKQLLFPGLFFFFCSVYTTSFQELVIVMYYIVTLGRWIFVEKGHCMIAPLLNMSLWALLQEEMP